MSLSGCIVGDGIAHVVKLASGDSSKTAAPSAPPPTAASEAPPPQDPGPPPPVPVAAPRSSISVESLDPPPAAH